MLIPARVVLPSLLFAGACVAAYAAQEEKVIFRKRLSNGGMARILLTTSTKHVESPPGSYIVGGEYIIRTYRLLLRSPVDGKEAVRWKKVLPTPERYAGTPLGSMELRVFDISVGNGVGYVLCSYNNRVRLETFDTAKEAQAQEGQRSIQLFREGLREARSGIIKTKGDEVYATIETSAGTREIWRSCEGKATLVKKTTVRRENTKRTAPSPDKATAADGQRNDTRKKLEEVLMQLAGKRHVDAALRGKALTLMGGTPDSALADDTALLLLSGIDKLDGADALMECYEACAPHLVSIHVEDQAKQQWIQYPRLKTALDELMGGDRLMGVFVRCGLLEELREQAELLRGKGGKQAEIKRIEEFVSAQAKKLLGDWPRSDLKAMVREMAGEKP